MIIKFFSSEENHHDEVYFRSRIPSLSPKHAKIMCARRKISFKNCFGMVYSQPSEYHRNELNSAKAKISADSRLRRRIDQEEIDTKS